jgi:hypothetical protein
MTHKSFLDDKEFESLNTYQLIETYQDGLLFERGRALFELARRSGKEENLIEVVKNEIVSEKNIKAKTVGLVSISFLGVVGLLAANTDSTKLVATEIIKSSQEPDRTNLIEFLRSAGYLPDDLSNI